MLGKTWCALRNCLFQSIRCKIHNHELKPICCVSGNPLEWPLRRRGGHLHKSGMIPIYTALKKVLWWGFPHRLFQA